MVVINGQAVKVPGPHVGPLLVGIARTQRHAAGRYALQRATTDFISGMVCRDRSTMRSWTALSLSAPPGRRWFPESVLGGVGAGRAIREWRRHFRGEPQVKDDTAITDEDIANSNLVLWGDPGSNKVLSRIAARLPLTWTADKLTFGGSRTRCDAHAPILIYPNPLNPKRYVVVNSGYTYREYDI